MILLDFLNSKTKSSSWYLEIKSLDNFEVLNYKINFFCFLRFLVRIFISSYFKEKIVINTINLPSAFLFLPISIFMKIFSPKTILWIHNVNKNDFLKQKKIYSLFFFTRILIFESINSSNKENDKVNILKTYNLKILNIIEPNKYELNYILDLFHELDKKSNKFFYQEITGSSCSGKSYFCNKKNYVKPKYNFFKNILFSLLWIFSSVAFLSPILISILLTHTKVNKQKDKIKLILSIIRKLTLIKIQGNLIYKNKKKNIDIIVDEGVLHILYNFIPFKNFNIKYLKLFFLLYLKLVNSSSIHSTIILSTINKKTQIKCLSRRGHKRYEKMDNVNREKFVNQSRLIDSMILKNLKESKSFELKKIETL